MATIFGLSCTDPPSHWSTERRREWIDVFDQHHPNKNGGGAEYKKSVETARTQLLYGGVLGPRAPRSSAEAAQRERAAPAGYQPDCSAEFRSSDEFRHFHKRNIRLKHNPQHKFVRPRTTAHEYGWRPGGLVLDQAAAGGEAEHARSLPNLTAPPIDVSKSTLEYLSADQQQRARASEEAARDDPELMLFRKMQNASEAAALAARAVQVAGGAPRRLKPGRYGVAPNFPKNACSETQFADGLFASGTIKQDQWYQTGSTQCEFLSNGVNYGYNVPTTTHAFL